MQHKLRSLFARLRYGGRGKAGRSRVLDEICVLCGYEREYASKLLRGRRPIAGQSGKCRGGSQRIYAAAKREVIKAIWLSAKQPCGKRLKAALPLWLPFYQKRHGQLESKVKAKLLGASAVFESGNQEPAFRKALNLEGRKPRRCTQQFWFVAFPTFLLS
jgi:hypothetical protein